MRTFELKYFKKIAATTSFQAFTVATFSILIFIFCLISPKYNWDAIGYTSVVHEQLGDSKGESQLQTYKELKSSWPSSQVKELTSGNFRQEAANNPDFLSALHGAYSSKILYVYLLQLGYILGFNIFQFSILLSALSASLALIVVYKIGRAIGIGFIPALAIPFLGGLIELGRYSTPDSLSALCLVLSIYSFIKCRNVQFYSFLFLSPFIRYENIIFVILLILISIYKNTYRVKKTIISFTSIGVLSIILLFFMKYQHAWTMRENLNFYLKLYDGDIPDSLTDLTSNFSIFLYFKVLFHAFLSAPPFIIAPLIVAYILIQGKLSIRSRYDQVVVSLLLFSFFKVVLFPNIEFRFYTVTFIISCYYFLSSRSLAKDG